MKLCKRSICSLIFIDVLPVLLLLLLLLSHVAHCQVVTLGEGSSEEVIIGFSNASMSLDSRNSTVAVLLSGNVNDLGFNYQINAGRLRTEMILNLTTSLFQNVDTPAKTTQIIEYLVTRGFNLIISTSLTQGDSAFNASLIYPDVFFVTRGSGNSTRPNVARITYDVTSADYMSGYFAGTVTKTNRVGIVTPGAALNSLHQANSFAVGAYCAAKVLGKNITVYSVETGSYLNPDVATIAAWNLLAVGADVLSQIQDDMTVSTISMNQGNLGIGTNGFPQRRVFGATVGTSYIIDWSIFFTDAIVRLDTNNWTVGWSYNGGFDNRVLHLDVFSRLVPRSAVQMVQAEELKFKTNTTYRPQNCFAPACDTIFKGNCTDGCISNRQWININKLLPSIVDLGTAFVPLTEVKIASGVQLVFTALGVGFAIACGVLIIAVIVLRNERPIRSASPLFCVIILVGGILVFVGCVIWVSYPTTIVCHLRYWIPSIGYGLIVGNLVVKNFRIYILFKAMKNPRITNLKLLPFSIGITSVHVLLLIIWSTVGNTKSIMDTNDDNIGKYEFVRKCHLTTAGDIIFYAILVIHGLILLVGCFVSFQIRAVDIEEFNESKSIAAFLYAVMFALFIIIPLFVSSTSTFNHIIILCVAFLFTAGSGLAIIFIPKFLMIKRLHKDTKLGIIRRDNISNFDSTESSSSINRDIFSSSTSSINRDIFSSSSSSGSDPFKSDPDFMHLPPSTTNTTTPNV
ncbi:G-protein-coupled receptor family 3 protein 6 [Heterostelium album PN500]|uniref:G-protein-coupled receptor family 3 protein 6 n=1 Tax=Heterostelium pallidum (strain ATCC 26659 / Pp 5 / PN500) TaxID=670386 RepID=D3BL16_HETP5|nr:G-protein-coupled receptor family 3 protein 6 [Heterostelium album PN500]EFA77750.1 G-protein-coupled receptor family 3 protein 6 [Heterostelium album PN500]|eukprot:XP_020429878.1 G-protein-coupled receptor family 3 protein 6 [Heterostelium album PN500]